MGNVRNEGDVFKNKGDAFKNVEGSVIATRGAVVNLRAEGHTETADALESLIALLAKKNAKVPAEARTEADEHVQTLEEEVNKKSKARKHTVKAALEKLSALAKKVKPWLAALPFLVKIAQHFGLGQADIGQAAVEP